MFGIMMAWFVYMTPSQEEMERIGGGAPRAGQHPGRSGETASFLDDIQRPAGRADYRINARCTGNA